MSSKSMPPTRRFFLFILFDFVFILCFSVYAFSQKKSGTEIQKNCDCSSIEAKVFNENSSSRMEGITYYDVLDFIEKINFQPKKVTQEKFKGAFNKVFSSPSKFHQLKIEAMYYVKQNGSYLKDKFSRDYCFVGNDVFSRYACYFQIILKIEELINNNL